MKKRILFAIGGGLILLLASPSFAAVVIDFEQGVGPGGTVVSNGVTASTINVPLNVLKVTGMGPDQVYDLSGTCSGTGQDSNGSACLSFDTAAGTLSITGGVVGLAGLPNGTLLLNGTFTSSSVSIPIAGLLVISGTGPDTKNWQLLSDLGISGPFAFFGFSVNAQTSGNNYVGTSTDIANTQVPEPASVAMLGGVLLLVAGALRRKAKGNA